MRSDRLGLAARSSIHQVREFRAPELAWSMKIPVSAAPAPLGSMASKMTAVTAQSEILYSLRFVGTCVSEWCMNSPRTVDTPRGAATFLRGGKLFRPESTKSKAAVREHMSMF